MKQQKTVFISADHGLAVIYFLQSDILPELLAADVRVVVLSDDALVAGISERFGRSGVLVEGLRLEQARQYFQKVDHNIQWWLDFLRRAGASNRINLQAVQSYVRQVESEAHPRRKALFPAMRLVLAAMHRSRLARQSVVRMQRRYTSNLYADLFDRYQPGAVIASTPGWRWDRYLLREAAQRGIQTGTVIVGWDNTSSYSLNGAPVQWVTCWSEIQKQELVSGEDWDPAQIHIGGIPSYDGYFRKEWLMPRQDYFQLHGLDPQRRLISYASSFVSFSPNIQNIEALARLVSSESLVKPAQLLVRLHPNHFMDVPRFAAEREQVRELARSLSHVHVVEPVPLAGANSLFGYYSGEDMDEKSSMMMYSDVMTTVYSTMVVEACTHGTPVVSVCIDSPVGWPGKFTLPLSQISGWPTHSRFLDSGAGRETKNEKELREALNLYLENPGADSEARRKFIERECTYTDGSAGKRTAEYLLSKLGIPGQD